MKHSLICVALLSAASLPACTTLAPLDAPRVTTADLERIAGDDWAGTLTYRDYSPPFGDVTLSVEAKLAPVPGGLSLSLHYPKEPSADGSSEILITDEGRTLDGATVTARTETADLLVIVTEEACQDDDRPATCKHVYTFSPDWMNWTKLVTFDEGGETIRRNAYTFSR
ncbi:MAG: hypothetical protein R3C13_06080 [Hyphomonas sp.]|uniref:hypothetical protein n=1 Tax=Hyphomonas sp. TaxID=87 RepID=UPI0035299C12